MADVGTAVGVEGDRPAATQRVLLIAAIVFAACLLGIGTRLPDTLAAFWPANALLLGIVLRYPRYALPAAWAVWWLAYLAADLLTGASLVKAVTLNGVNLLGVMAAYYLFRRLPEQDRTLGRVRAVGYLVAIGLTAALVAGTAGGLADILLFDGSWIGGFLIWFPTELVHYLTVMPLALSCPPFWRGAGEVSTVQLLWLVAAVVMLAACLVLAVVIGGLGALTFPVPVLVVTALLTSIFITALCTALASTAVMLLSAHGLVGASTDLTVPVSASVQIGLALLAVGPIAVACVMADRRRLLDEVRNAGVRDDLTGALRRDEFDRRAELGLRRPGSAALLLIDLDHFKSVNDALGHLGGDDVLRDFADRVRAALRTDDLFGRFGGEEFVVLLPGLDADAAHAVAERLRTAQQSGAVTRFGDHGPTISVGVAVRSGSATLTELFDIADAALYRAKVQRNTTVVGPTSD